jgi:hypothetical protein
MQSAFSFRRLMHDFNSRAGWAIRFGTHIYGMAFLQSGAAPGM